MNYAEGVLRTIFELLSLLKVKDHVNDLKVISRERDMIL